MTSFLTYSSDFPFSVKWYSVAVKSMGLSVRQTQVQIQSLPVASGPPSPCITLSVSQLPPQ